MTEKIYLAGKFPSRRRIQRLAIKLQDRGHEIVSTWLTDVPPVNEQEDLERYHRDVKNVLSSTVFIIILEKAPMIGAMIELGIAYSLPNRKIYSIGEAIYDSPMLKGIQIMTKDIDELIEKTEL